MFKGEWKVGKMDGEGIIVSEKGIATKGIWKAGKFVKKLN
jgi:hypothetical protein